MSKITAYGAFGSLALNDLLIGVDVSDATMAATGTDKKLTVSQLFAAAGFNLVLPSGDTTGVTDAAAIQAALNSGPTWLTPGLYFINATLNVPAAGVLTGPPSAVNVAPGASHVMPVIIKLANASNTHMVNISGNNAYVGNLELDGNKAGQSTAFGNGILYQNWFYAVFERLFIHDQFFRGINMVTGTAARVVNCSVSNNRDAGIFMDSGSTDNTVRDCFVANNASDGIVTAGFVQHIYGNDIWGNTNNGVKVTGGRAVLIANNGIDHNQQHGIAVVGPVSGSASSVAITGNSLHSNSQQSNAGFNSVQIDNTNGTVDGVSVTGNNFWLDGGVTNKVAYHISYVSTVATKAHGNQFQSGSSATGTISAASSAKDANETG